MGAEELQASRVFRHRKYAFSTDEQTKGLKVSTSEGEEARYAVSVGGMFVHRLKDRAVKVYRKSTAAEGSTQCNDMHFAMVVPPAEAAGTNTAAVHAGAARRMQEACFIAGINCPSSASTAGEALVHPTNAATAPTVTAHTYNTIDCIVAAYTRRVNALRPAERASLVVSESCSAVTCSPWGRSQLIYPLRAWFCAIHCRASARFCSRWATAAPPSCWCS